MVTLASVGVVFAAFYVYTRYAGFIQNIGEFAFYIGTGCMFPVVLLPFWATPVGLAVLSADVGVDALRVLAIPGYSGFALGVRPATWPGPSGTTLVYLSIAGTVFHKVERHVLGKSRVTSGRY